MPARSALFLIPPALLAQAPRTPSRDELAAQRMLDLAAHRKNAELRRIATSAEDPIDRLFAAFLLYKKDPKANARLFTQAMPADRKEADRLVELNGTITMSDPGVGEESRMKVLEVARRLNYERIYQACLERARSGDHESLRRFLLIQGGDGEIAEEGDYSLAILFQNPKAVLANWDLMESCKDTLGMLDDQLTEKEAKAARAAWRKALKPGDPRREELLKILDGQGHP